VPYKGSGPAVADLVGGRVQIMFDAAPSLIAHVRSGKLRVLAAASSERNRLLPEVPTFAEVGLPGGKCVAVVRAAGAGRHAAADD
jgi:tripartite-type tricarboxylate transporter receptor subunit TctC